MTAASQLRQRRHASSASRLFAACFGLWFLACGFIGARHEAEITHVVDQRTGLVFHASRVSDHHDATKPADIHRHDESDGGHECALSTALHQAASDRVSRPSAVDRGQPSANTLSVPGVVGRVERGVYRLAPKTSPPTFG